MPYEGKPHPQFSGCRYSTRYGTYICDDGYDESGNYSIDDLENAYGAGYSIAGPPEWGGSLTGSFGTPPGARNGGQVAGSGLGPGIPAQQNRDADSWAVWAAQGPFNILSPGVDTVAAVAPSSSTLAKVALTTGLSIGAVQIGLIVAGVFAAFVLLKSK